MKSEYSFNRIIDHFFYFIYSLLKIMVVGRAKHGKRVTCIVIPTTWRHYFVSIKQRRKRKKKIIVPLSFHFSMEKLFLPEKEKFHPDDERSRFSVIFLFSCVEVDAFLRLPIILLNCQAGRSKFVRVSGWLSETGEKSLNKSDHGAEGRGNTANSKKRATCVAGRHGRQPPSQLMAYGHVRFKNFVRL